MTTPRRKLIVERGSNPILVLVWRDAETCIPIDLAGYTAKLYIRETAQSDTLLEEWSTALGTIALNAGGETGRIEVNADTRTSNWVKGVYDLAVYPGGDEAQGRRLQEGVAVLSWGVSR